MAKTLRRSDWRKSNNETWTCSLGQRGMRVRLFNKRKDGVFYRAVWDSRRKRKSVASLGTHDRGEALHLGRQLFAELLKGEPVNTEGPISLGTLWTEFSAKCVAFLDNKPKTRADTKARVEILRAYFGDSYDVRRFAADDQREYARARRTGGIELASARRTPPVRERSVEADLVALHQMLAWATTARTSNGGRWLERNPLAGVRREREKNPRRAVATWDRCQSTRNAIQELRDAGGARERVHWLKIELALVLAEATGRPLGSIRALRWEDIDFDRQTIRWRAEADKKGVEWIIPIPETLIVELRDFQRAFGVTTDLLFSSDSREDVPMDRHLFNRWLSAAERHAGLPKLQGALWHSYRRKWASERRHLSIVDVAAAGGWKGTETLLESYIQPDPSTLLRVTSEPQKRHEDAAA